MGDEISSHLILPFLVPPLTIDYAAVPIKAIMWVRTNAPRKWAEHRYAQRGACIRFFWAAVGQTLSELVFSWKISSALFSRLDWPHLVRIFQ